MGILSETKNEGHLRASLSVIVGPPNRDGRTTTKVPMQEGIERIFWKRGSWHVRLTTWPADPVVHFDLQDDDKRQTIRGREMTLPKFQGVVVLKRAMRKIVITIWQNFEKLDFLDEDLPKPAKVRLGFILSVVA